MASASINLAILASNLRFLADETSHRHLSNETGSEHLRAEVHLDEKPLFKVYLDPALEAALFDGKAFGNDISLG